MRGLVRAEIERRHLPAGSAPRHGAGGNARALARRAAAIRAGRLVSSANDAGSAPIESLRVATEEAERELDARWRRVDRTRERTDVGMAEVRARLAPGQALVGFVETEADKDSARLTALVLKAGSQRIAWIELGRSAAIESGRRGLEPKARRTSRPRSERGPGPNAGARARGSRASLGSRVVPELAGVSDVLLVPDGPLIRLSWQALPVGDHKYLVESGPMLHVLNAEREVIGRRDNDLGRVAAGARRSRLRTRCGAIGDAESPRRVGSVCRRSAEVRAASGDRRRSARDRSHAARSDRVLAGVPPPKRRSSGTLQATKCSTSPPTGWWRAHVLGGLAGAARRRRRRPGFLGGALVTDVVVEREAGSGLAVAQASRVAGARQREPRRRAHGRRERGLLTAEEVRPSISAAPTGRAVGLSLGNRRIVVARGRPRDAARLPPRRCPDRDREPVVGRRRGPRASGCRRSTRHAPAARHSAAAALQSAEPHDPRRAPSRRALDPSVLLAAAFGATGE